MSRTKPVLTRLLLALVDENARYSTALKVIEAEIKDAEEKHILVGVEKLKNILAAANYPGEKVDIPTYEEFVKEYTANEDEA